MYNDAGDLIEKKDHEGKKWIYEYYANGLMSKVTRPDKNEVTFEYDPLGRRVSKTYKGKITKFLWDGNKVLHEWRECQEQYEDTETRQKSTQENINDQVKIKETNQQPQNITTWLYKDGSFAPIGKLTENDSYSIVTDHLDTPTEMYNSKGERVWKVIRDIYGRERHKVGGETYETDCQIRFQGQYEDYETGFYYNRFRYYMPEESMYSQRDPIGIAGGNPSLYGYVWDSSMQVDVFGLDPKIPTLGNGNTDNLVNGLETRGYKPNDGERTFDGFVNNNVSPDAEVTLHTKSSGFNTSTTSNLDGQFKRFGTEPNQHGISGPHVHQPTRNVAPNGTVYGGQGTKTGNGGVTTPSKKDVSQLYDYLFNGKYQN